MLDAGRVVENVLGVAGEIAMEELAIEIVPMPPSVAHLFAVVGRAANELQDMGEKSNRIALQLLQALAAAEKELGQ